jgi:hypothetical protein
MAALNIQVDNGTNLGNDQKYNTLLKAPAQKMTSTATDIAC